MIELMGVGVPRGRDGWLLRELCTTFEGGTLVVIGAITREERLAVLDVAAARVIPREGRAWIDHHPLMRSTARTIRRLTSDVDPAASLGEARSIGWNVMAPAVTPLRLRGLLRLPRPGRRQAAVDALATVGLLGRFHDPAFLLTASERVRVLLARARAWPASPARARAGRRCRPTRHAPAPGAPAHPQPPPHSCAMELGSGSGTTRPRRATASTVACGWSPADERGLPTRAACAPPGVRPFPAPRGSGRTLRDRPGGSRRRSS